MRAPDPLVYLQRSVVGCRTRVAGRGRVDEESISSSYLEGLSVRYDAWFEAWNRSRKLLVRADNYDFLESDEHLNTLVSRVEEALI